MTVADERQGFELVSSPPVRPAPLPVVPAEPPVPTRASAARPAWLVRYRRSVIALDLLIAAVVGLIVVLVDAPGGSTAVPDQRWLGALVPVLWMASAALRSGYDPRVFGTGSEEYRRVGSAGVLLVVAVVFAGQALGLQLPQHLVLTVPALTVAVCAGRYLARSVLQHARAAGRCSKRVLLVGREGALIHLVEQLRRDVTSGMRVVGACVTDPLAAGRLEQLGVPVVGDLTHAAAAVRQLEADTVAVGSASETAGQYLRALAWQLEGSGVELLVSPGLMEVAGPRLHIRPFEGLPLLSVEQPRYEGWQRVVKGGVDRLAAGFALVVLAPVLLGIALAVRLDSAGPVLYRQERVGLNGQPFTMLKFRSMVVDAEQRLAAIQSANMSDGLLFKMRRDPRVTRVGRVLRRLSLDELPQLVNVLNGTMSLVGPRPPLPREVARYEHSVSRRLLVKPGLTGLWQISGRSDLPWEEAVRLDLRYVENWSLWLDLSILRRTLSAVLQSRGAY
jgi:exopolysaccharide biosynthesis polyprenyl glycosylphosphotransferase